jgi:phage terminase large subunit GpA-like protein
MKVKAWVHGVLSGIYQPQPRESIWQWAERTLKIPAGGENADMAGQPWSSNLSPYIREVMDWFRQPGKSQLYIAKSSQVGFTMAMLIVICWHIVHRPVNIGYYIDSAEEARKISKSRLKRWIKDNRLLEDIGESSDDLSNLTYFLKGMVVYLMGTHATGAFRNKQLGIAILDEWDAHPDIEGEGTSGELVKGRVKRSRNSKLIGFSTPILETGQTWQGFESGTQEKFFIPCPHCGHFQPLEWKRVRFSGPEFEDLAKEHDLAIVKDRAFYECEMSCRIEHADKYAAMLRGEWRATNPKAPPGVRSMHISDLYSNFVTWGELAVEWIAAQRNMDKLRAFINQRLGEPFRQQSGTLKEKDILNLRQTNFERGKCPIVPVLVGLLVDVQAASMKWTLCAYTRDGSMLVVDWGECASWEEIATLAYHEVPIPGGHHRVDAGLIDEGDGNRMHEVRRFTLGHDHLFPVKGRGQSQIKDLYWPSKTDLDGQVVLTYHINDPAWKSELLFNRIQRDRKRKDYDLGRLVLPWRVTEDFVAELLNERREIVKNKYGFEEPKWIKSGPNDWLDCLKYGLAFWAILEPYLREAGKLDTPQAAA